MTFLTGFLLIAATATPPDCAAPTVERVRVRLDAQAEQIPDIETLGQLVPGITRRPRQAIP